MEKFQGISGQDTEAFRKSYEDSALCHAMTNALYKNSVKDVSFNSTALRDSQFQFSIDLPTMEVTDQMRSGRCWIFSALNVLREQVAKKCNLEKFELSQNYVAFWDKFEKINYFLESVIDLADRPTDDRLLEFLLSSGIADGGQWDMLVNIVEKYGVVPKAAMEETYQSSHTADMNHLINAKLRRYAAQLRAAAKAGKDLQTLKKGMLEELYRFLCMCFGEPPKQFDFEYVDKDKKYHIVHNLTPKAFYQTYVGLNLREDFVSLINSPTGDKPFYQTYTVDYLGNVADGSPVHYLNLPMEELKTLIVAQLQDGVPVWFGSDVGHLSDREKGLWSGEAFDFSGTFGMDFSMTKAERLDYRESAMNHAMVITGVNLNEAGVPTKWKIENSWSDKHGDKGYYQMSASWFDTFVYQAVVNKKYLSEKQRRALETAPKHLNPWDPMGTLAD
ncbi:MULTISPECIES: C1 family peptidase [Caproicibacterium]|uniref:Aminopeptidase n=1 Tax=Caproicibacterium argilliputei TaxID=3030016 RepID=A0AA97DBQ0_9FIRM|nr:C1 family peptidase [Caproicibacterium argilliputei]WOC32678.1 C1 family peptidase [Caproicibacterium argilliputei]